MNGEKLNGNNQFFDEELSRKSNLCIFGFNGCGKTRLACSITSLLNKQGFWVVVFDSVGVWRKTSDLPKIRKFQFFYEAKWDKFDFLGDSIIYDISSILLEEQVEFVNEWCRQYWNYRMENESEKPCLIVLEEAELYAKNLKSEVAQQIFRIAMSGRNHPFNTRILAISPRMSNLATEIVEQSEQVYAGFTIGENNKRKVRSMFGKEWIEPVGILGVGMFVWRHGKKIEIVKVPLFERQSEPQLVKPNRRPPILNGQPIEIPKISKKKSLVGRIFFG